MIFFILLIISLNVAHWSLVEHLIFRFLLYIIGCGLLNAPHLLSIDIDIDALNIAAKNMNGFELQSSFDFLNYDLVDNIEIINYLAQRKVVDVVVMNPPFGTKNNQG